MNQKLRFVCFRGIHNSLSSFCAKLGYSRIKIDHIADSLLKFQIKIGVHFITVELSQLLTLRGAHLVCHRASVLCFSTLVSLLQMYAIYNVIILVISLLRSHRISHAPNSEHTWQTPF